VVFVRLFLLGFLKVGLCFLLTISVLLFRYIYIWFLVLKESIGDRYIASKQVSKILSPSLNFFCFEGNIGLIQAESFSSSFGYI
jgi:hypothetical protein